MSEEKAAERERKGADKLRQKLGEKRAKELLTLIHEATSQKGGKEV